MGSVVNVKNISVIVLCGDRKGRDERKVLELYEMFKQYIPDYQIKQWVTFVEVHIPIDRHTEAFDKLMCLAKENGVLDWYYEYMKHTKKEEREAEFFQMFVSHPLQAEGTFSKDYGTKYLNCCNTCKINGTPVGDVLVDRKFVKKCEIASLVPDIFVSKEVKWLIETSGLTGVHFEKRVMDYKGREIKEYHVMSFDSILPPMDEETWFCFDPIAYECKECGRRVPYLRSHFYYKQADLADAKDFNLTYEVFDNWREHGIVVSKKAREVLDKAKIRVGYHMINVI